MAKVGYVDKLVNIAHSGYGLWRRGETVAVDFGVIKGPATYQAINNEVRFHLPSFEAWGAYTVVLGRAAEGPATAVP